jgi:hypothetical protein
MQHPLQMFGVPICSHRHGPLTMGVSTYGNMSRNNVSFTGHLVASSRSQSMKMAPANGCKCALSRAACSGLMHIRTHPATRRSTGAIGSKAGQSRLWGPASTAGLGLTSARHWEGCWRGRWGGISDTIWDGMEAGYGGAAAMPEADGRPKMRMQRTCRHGGLLAAPVLPSTQACARISALCRARGVPGRVVTSRARAAIGRVRGRLAADSETLLPIDSGGTRPGQVSHPIQAVSHHTRLPASLATGLAITLQHRVLAEPPATCQPTPAAPRHCRQTGCGTSCDDAGERAAAAVLVTWW